MRWLSTIQHPKVLSSLLWICKIPTKLSCFLHQKVWRQWALATLPNQNPNLWQPAKRLKVRGTRKEGCTWSWRLIWLQKQRNIVFVILCCVEWTVSPHKVPRYQFSNFEGNSYVNVLFFVSSFGWPKLMVNHQWNSVNLVDFRLPGPPPRHAWPCGCRWATSQPGSQSGYSFTGQHFYLLLAVPQKPSSFLSTHDIDISYHLKFVDPWRLWNGKSHHITLSLLLTGWKKLPVPTARASAVDLKTPWKKCLDSSSSNLKLFGWNQPFGSWRCLVEFWDARYEFTYSPFGE